jgi:PhzF family phenazine biosynthesis protein
MSELNFCNFNIDQLIRQTMRFSLISVFTGPKENFRGNTAVVVLLDKEISESQMQQIAEDFNQPATTYIRKSEFENIYHIRWFAPDMEIGLCGHGTIAATAFLADDRANQSFTFLYKDGKLSGGTDSKGMCSIVLNAIYSEELPEIPETLKNALNIPIAGLYKTSDKYLVLTETEEHVKNMKPDFSLLKQLDIFGYAVTAKGNEYDFVSRTLVPHVQQLEDPATGSSHAALVPFWAERLSKRKLKAVQLSKRGGKFYCEIQDEMVTLKGFTAPLAEGVLFDRK